MFPTELDLAVGLAADKCYSLGLMFAGCSPSLPPELEAVLGASPNFTDLGDELCIGSITDPTIAVILRRGAQLSSTDAEFIVRTVNERKVIEQMSLRFLAGQVTVPTKFSSTQFLFRGGDQFDVHILFDESATPNNGVLVEFQGREPKKIIDLSSPDSWWDGESSSWIPS